MNALLQFRFAAAAFVLASGPACGLLGPSCLAERSARYTIAITWFYGPDC